MTNKKSTKKHTPPMMVRLSQADIDRIDEIIKEHGVANRSDVIRVAIRFLEYEVGNYQGWISLMLDKFGRVKDK